MKEPTIAVYIDFENLALGVRDLKGSDKFQIVLILNRLLEKGRIVLRRAYSDWNGYRDYVREFHSHGIELIDIPQSKMSGKNSADIRMVVDAMDLCHTNEHIDHFALISGDSDFSPLVAKLKENNKRVIGCGIKSSTSNLLVAACDEFIYYDDLIQPAPTKKRPPRKSSADKPVSEKTVPKVSPERTAPVKTKPAPKDSDNNKVLETGAETSLDAELKAVVEIISSLQSEYDPLWGSMVKQTVKRVNPGFQERSLGYRNFGELLEDLEEQGYVELEYDKERGNHTVKLAQG